MEKVMYVEGMTCGHCQARVEKALNKIDGVNAKVDLANKLVNVKLAANVDNNVLKEAVENVGYDVTSIK